MWKILCVSVDMQSETVPTEEENLAQVAQTSHHLKLT